MAGTIKPQSARQPSRVFPRRSAGYPTVMNSRYIEAFRAVMLCGTVTEGSRFLNVSQPAVSRLISSLESDLGFALFDRLKGRLVPTPEGIAFYDEVQRSYLGLSKLAEAAQAIRDFRDGQVRVATLAAFSSHLLPSFIASFSRQFPTVTFQVHVLGPERIRAGVASQQYHVGLVSLPVDPATTVEFYVTTAAVCVLPRQHRLARKPQIDVVDLSDVPLVIVPREYPLRLEVEAEFQRHKLYPNIKAETTITLAACGLVQQGLGVAITEPFTPLLFRNAGLVVKPCAKPFKFRFAVITSGIGGRHRLTDQYVAELRKHLEAVKFPRELKINLTIERPA